MPAWVSWGALVALATVGTQFVMFLRWLHRRMRDDEIVHAFVRDLAEVQLPYLHSALRELAEQQGIHLEDAPLIRYVNFQQNGRKRHAS